MRKLATIERIQEIQPIPKADFIEKARVRGWWVVIKKNDFKVGDLCIYYEIDSFLPIRPEYEFLLKGNSIKKMMVGTGLEIEGIRLRTVCLKGQISQGLILPISLFAEVRLSNLEEGTDITSLLGVILYENPGHKGGAIKGVLPGYILKTDETRIQNILEVLEEKKGEMFYSTEKLDGTSASYWKWQGEFGIGGREVEYEQSDSESLFCSTANELKLKELIPEGYCIQGEMIGEGIQKNPLKVKGQRFYVFSVFNITEQSYLVGEDFFNFVYSIGLLHVPLIDNILRLNYTLEEMLSKANGCSMLNSDARREGIVVRHKTQQPMLSFKVISNQYLLKEH